LLKVSGLWNDSFVSGCYSLSYFLAVGLGN